jgi:hypothetical protein
MRPGKIYGKMKPMGGAEIGLRMETEEGRVYAAIFIQSLAEGKPGGGTILGKSDAKKLIGWLNRYLKDAK